MDVAHLCSDLVRIRSENPPGNTEEVIRYLKDFTDGLGLKTRIVRSRGGRHNLVTSKPSGTLLFCGHVDVVPALSDRWSHDPFEGEVDGGIVWGRGTTDMKGGCAALLWACKEFIDTGRELPADLALVCDEETSGTYGVQRLLSKKCLVPCDTVIAEPTPALSPNIGQKGLLRLCCTFHGEPGHGSLYPVRGVSAVMEAFSLLEFMKALHERIYDPGDPELGRIIAWSSGILGDVFGLDNSREVLTRVMFNPGMISGGEKANIVAQQCSLELDLRPPWGCSFADLIQEIRDHAPRAEVAVTNMSEPSITPPDSPLVIRLLEEIGKVYQSPARPIVQWAASDARYLRRAGFRVAEYGPGEMRTLHAIDEHVTIASLENAVKVYRGMLERYGEV
ncbi:MAG: M20/M25/M40 family metallo-hydrolase [Methanolinea sp.]|nr:M20/M25/M40 family metallo-hydrolase [Methanolinea sp.]